MLDGTVLGNDGNVYHQDELETIEPGIAKRPSTVIPDLSIPISHIRLPLCQSFNIGFVKKIRPS